jgi:Tfp pilus assembly protein PilN
MANLLSKKNKQEINLLPEREFAGTVTGRVLSWIISTFRVIVIVTEILVMVAFLARFWLDAQNTDLNDDIDKKKAVLLASTEFESQYKDVQKRLKVFASLANNQPSSKFISAVSTALPPDVLLSDISKLSEELQLEGLTTNERSIQQFVVNLQSSGLFGDVALQDIKTSQTNVNLLSFTIKAVITEKASLQERSQTQ